MQIYTTDQLTKLRAKANQYRSAAAELYLAGVYVTSTEAAKLAGFIHPRGFNTILMAESRGKLINYSTGPDHLYDVADIVGRWSNGPGGQAYSKGGLDAVRRLVCGMRESGGGS